jgi:hypothetical protein
MICLGHRRRIDDGAASRVRLVVFLVVSRRCVGSSLCGEHVRRCAISVGFAFVEVGEELPMHSGI